MARSAINWGPATLGVLLRPEVQREALTRYVHRFTGDHRPAWVDQLPRSDGKPYPLQFASDAEWLSNSTFRTNRDGTLDGRVVHCTSYPTWPLNPELRGPHGGGYTAHLSAGGRFTQATVGRLS